MLFKLQIVQDEAEILAAGLTRDLAEAETYRLHITQAPNLAIQEILTHHRK